MNTFLSQLAEVRRAVNATAAGTTTINGSGINMAGYEAVQFVAMFGTLTGTQVTSLKVQQSSDDGSSDTYDDLAGSNTGPLADTDGNKMLVTDLIRPAKQYVRPVVVRGTANAVIDGVVAILYKPRSAATTTGTTVSASKRLITPAEGTA